MPDGQIGFVGKDVATVLGYKNTCKALTDHVETEDKVVTFCYSLGGKQKTTVINESGLYALRTLPKKGVAFCDSLGGKQKATIISESGLYS